MIQLLLAAYLGLAPTSGVTAPAAPDSIVAERLVKLVPHKVAMQDKRSGIGPEEFFDGMVHRLQQAGFFQLSPDAIGAACGPDAMIGNRLTIRVRENANWRELIVPDSCDSGSPELRQQLTDMRKDGWDVLIHVRSHRPGR
jgi:hypothetical protein